LENLNIEGRIILRCISKKQPDGAGIGLMWLRTGTNGGRAAV
jgi:hypothetical protein